MWADRKDSYPPIHAVPTCLDLHSAVMACPRWPSRVVRPAWARDTAFKGDSVILTMSQKQMFGMKIYTTTVIPDDMDVSLLGSLCLEPT